MATRTETESASRVWTFEEKVMAFWSKVDRSAGPDACWTWTGAVTSKWGYGCFGVAKVHTRGAHKIAWLLTNGDNNGLCVLHRCDNRVCVNPAHLFLGTKIDNALDKVQKGRDSTAALKADQVRAIRVALAERKDFGLQTVLAKEYGVTVGVINRVAVGRSYQWVK